MSDRVVTIIQARMGSSRLPGKSLADLGGRPAIDWVVERVASAQLVDRVIVATSTLPEDDELAHHVRDHGWATVYRGDPLDVLSRYVGAVSDTSADTVVRITGDCPFVQPELVDVGVRTLDGCDYVATDYDGRFPRGFDAEAMRRDALEAAAAEADDPIEREHVTRFIVRRPERFSFRALPCPSWAQHPDLRLTLDEATDLRALRAIIDELGVSPESLNGPDVIELLLERPDLVAINRDVQHRTVW